MSVADLSKFRTDRTAKPEWTLEPVQPRFSGTVLAVDQSLRSAGWVVIVADIETASVEVAAQGVIGVVSEEDGHAGTLAVGTLQFGRYLGLLEEFNPDLVVHEYPPVGSRMMRPESSLVSAMSLRCAAVHHRVPVTMVASQRAKKRWTGNGNAEKKTVRKALLELDPTLVGRKPFNEHIADAIALGWVAVEEEQ